MQKKAQGAIEFFLISGFILLATSVLLTQSDNQIRGTTALSNVLVSRSALDLEISALRYAQLSGNGTIITNKVFVPVGAQCFFPEDAYGRLYCLVPGAQKKVVSETLDFPLPGIQTSCQRAGWITMKTSNKDGSLLVNCT